MITSFSGEASYNIFLDGQFYGPFSESLLIEEINDQNIGADLLVWTESLQDWAPIAEVSNFLPYQPLLTDKTRLSPNLAERQQRLVQSFRLKNLEVIEQKRENFARKEKRLKDSQIDTINNTLNMENSQNAEEKQFVDIDGTPFSTQEPEERVRPWKRQAMGAIATLIVMSSVGYYYAVLQFKTTYESILNQIDASEHDIKRIKTFLWSGTEDKALIFTEKSDDDTSIHLRLFAHWPDQSRVLVTLTGIRKTLLGAIYEKIESEVFIKDSTGSSKSLNSLMKKTPASGFYRVNLKCVNCTGSKAQPIQLLKPLALGIPDNKAYAQKLNEFHSLLKRQAESEIIELNEILILLRDRSLGSINRKEDRLQKQLWQVLTSIDKDVAQSSYIFGSVYLAMKDYLLSMDKINRAERGQTLQELKKKISKLPNAIKNGTFLDDLLIP